MTSVRERQIEANLRAAPDLLAMVRDAGVEFVYYQFVSINGRVMAKVVPARHLERKLEQGVQFHDSGVADLASNRAGELIASGPHTEEIVALPEAGTFTVLPWDRSFGRFFCNLYRRPDSTAYPDEPLPSCARGHLARAHEAFAAEHGMTLRSGCEPEMSWIGEGLEPWTQPHVAPNYHVGALEGARTIVKKVITYATEMGLDMIEGDYEDHGQLELNFAFDDCELTADRLVTYRQICRQVAQEHGVMASFMPKPAVGAMANACHHNLSLWRGEENVLIDPAGTGFAVSDLARHAIGGLLEHSPGMAAIMAPTVNSYARYWDVGQFAPTIANWGLDNRTCAVRVSAPGRLEYKLPDASVNPYLSHAALLGAISDGIRRELDPGPPQPGDTYDPEVDEAERLARPGAELPRTLGEALETLAGSRVIRDALTPELYDVFVEYKTDEWERYCGAVTDWHREMYLQAIP